MGVSVGYNVGGQLSVGAYNMFVVSEDYYIRRPSMATFNLLNLLNLLNLFAVHLQSTIPPSWR